MKRLSDAAIEIINELNTEMLSYESEYIPLIDAANRLSEYEDTGMEPEEILKAMGAMKSALGLACALQSYRDAEREGRLVVLPCKVGDTVYKIMGDKIMEMRAVAIPLLISSSGAHLSITSTNYRGAALSLEPSDFGKTVFLTRAEAEAAMKGGDNGCSNFILGTDGRKRKI